jgi:hypothetical protein
MLNRLRAGVVVAGLVALGSVAVSTQVNAFVYRNPQIPVLGGTLQGYVNSKGETFNVLTDQKASQVWAQSVSGNSLLTLMIELSGNAAGNTFGIYNATAVNPPLYQIFPGAAAAGWKAMISFHIAPIRVVINLFDANSVIQGTTTYLGADAGAFGFYMQDVNGNVFYSQDARNPGGQAQMLAYQGTGLNFGEWWLCWEDVYLNGGSSDQDFDDAVMILESVNPLATKQMSLGKVKSLYR